MTSDEAASETVPSILALLPHDTSAVMAAANVMILLNLDIFIVD